MRATDIRHATLGDVPALAETVEEGFESYRIWAPRGWDPPSAAVHLAGIRDRLPEPGCVCLLAEDGGEMAGHVAYGPAREEPGVAHIWMLFVRARWWGTGVATDLLARAVATATAEGYAAMRLHTPAAHARARAFYEREGWVTDGVRVPEPMLGIDLVLYTRGMPGSGGRAAPS
jgi:GNAT superfamily N-acetyltransferase